MRALGDGYREAHDQMSLQSYQQFKLQLHLLRNAVVYYAIAKHAFEILARKRHTRL
jgi:hypothetical protein